MRNHFGPVLLLASALALLVASGTVTAQTGSSGGGNSTQPSLAPRGNPSSFGPGMMGPGYGPNQQYPYAQQQPQKPIDKDQAKSIVENYLKSTGNPNLKLGDIKDEGQNFEADVVTKDNSLADKILIDKNSGWMRPAY